MSDFVQGQRWLIDSEPELGLGMVQSIDVRSVTLFFPASNTERIYSTRSAPLTRFLLDQQDPLETRDGETFTVSKVHSLDGLNVYEVDDGRMVPETELTDTVKMDNPFMRLVTGQTDHPNWFTLRAALNRGIQNIWNARMNGLLGTRSTLLPHQLYVALRATDHTHVRALLSDEVGLGKTIEAGLIMNRLMCQNRASRILIAVPVALQAQWLVELIRRFSIHCEFYQTDDHDFSIGQVHLVTHRQLVSSEVSAQIAEHAWDMIVVDEAHHLTIEDSSADATWVALTAEVPHLLLLTATPEQLGLQAHFSRLQLIDSGRFTSLEKYQQDEKNFAEYSELARRLHEGKVETQDVQALSSLDIAWHGDATQALNALLDRHGTGRVVYRNTRKSVSGFHERRTHLVTGADDEDRIVELVRLLKAHRDLKFVLITQQTQTAKELALQLWQKHGIDATAFHDELDLIERDRAAAHFSDLEDGAQILVCSEIGGEGRNFQFSHHLVLWDIPEHPDTLEQRIGRLDRIGQTDTINIHCFLLDGSESLTRYQWFHGVLNSMERIQPAAGAMHDKYFSDWLANPSEELIHSIREEYLALTEQLESGRNVLLELNSCRQPDADQIKENVQQLESDHPYWLVELASSLLNLHFESLSSDIYELIPSSNMLIPILPGIPEGGATVTFLRDVAAAREDILFLSWEHPFIQGLADMLSGSELGQASIALLESNQVPAGQLLLEAQWKVAIPKKHEHALRPHFEEALFRTLLLEGGDKNLDGILKEAALREELKTLPVKVARNIIREAKARLNPLFEVSNSLAQKRFDDVLAKAKDALTRHNQDRIERLNYLAEINPLVTLDDVEHARAIAEEQLAAISDCQFNTEGVRLILCAPAGG